MNEVKNDELYKYTKLCFVNSALYNGIYASPLYNLNDPYEHMNVAEEDDYRVVCLTRSRNKKLMWSHYADGHRGCSIKISVPTDYRSENCVLKRVTYTSNLINRSEMNNTEFMQSLYTKDKKWDYELEVRAVYSSKNSSSDYWKKSRKNIFLKVNITQIDFGCFSHYDSNYLDALIAIRDYNTYHRKKIQVRKYKMSDRKYEFKIDRSFDYIKEIAKLVNGEKK